MLEEERRVRLRFFASYFASGGRAACPPGGDRRDSLRFSNERKGRAGWDSSGCHRGKRIVQIRRGRRQGRHASATTSSEFVD